MAFTNTPCRVSSRRASVTYCKSIAALLNRGGTYRCLRIQRLLDFVSRQTDAATTSYTRCHTTSSSFSVGLWARGSTRGIPPCFDKPPRSCFTSSFCFAKIDNRVVFFVCSSSLESSLELPTPFRRENQLFFRKIPASVSFNFNLARRARRFFFRATAKSIAASICASTSLPCDSLFSIKFNPNAPACTNAMCGRMSWCSCDRVSATTVMRSLAFSSARTQWWDTFRDVSGFVSPVPPRSHSRMAPNNTSLAISRNGSKPKSRRHACFMKSSMRW
mmetsp:Transcript_1094/g.4150  ORF Transcript_1094/g.4150 Transcript_1094/m.4150 type:complete len:275 (+) Transcript_1094:1401-2225(+)